MRPARAPRGDPSRCPSGRGPPRRPSRPPPPGGRTRRGMARGSRSRATAGPAPSAPPTPARPGPRARGAPRGGAPRARRPRPARRRGSSARAVDGVRVARGRVADAEHAERHGALDPPAGGHPERELDGRPAATDRPEPVDVHEGAARDEPGGRPVEGVGQATARDVAVDRARGERRGVRQERVERGVVEVVEHVVARHEVEAAASGDEVPARRREERDVGVAAPGAREGGGARIRVDPRHAQPQPVASGPPREGERHVAASGTDVEERRLPLLSAERADPGPVDAAPSCDDTVDDAEPRVGAVERDGVAVRVVHDSVSPVSRRERSIRRSGAS